MKQGVPITPEQWQLYLDTLANCGIRAEARRAAEISNTSVTNRIKSDPDFAEAVEAALDEAADALEQEARRRALDGVEREKFIGSGERGQFITERQYSDTLMMFLLKGAKPDRFADRVKSEISGPEGKPIDVNDTTGAARIAAMLEEARRRRDAQGDDLDPLG